MRQETTNNNQPEANMQANDAGTQTYATAFEYLKSLPRNLDRPALESYKRGRTSDIIDCQVAEDFTDGFRNTSDPFYIPVSWSLTKTALLNLLGITSHQGYAEVSGVRFYGGLNGDNYLTLIAVSTTEGTAGNDDLTLADDYPYYDYADMCPSHCSTSGNLRVMNGPAVPMQVTIVP
jgi:hypothetical protein